MYTNENMMASIQYVHWINVDLITLKQKIHAKLLFDIAKEINSVLVLFIPFYGSGMSNGEIDVYE